jgi:hypothetical protein
LLGLLERPTGVSASAPHPLFPLFITDTPIGEFVARVAPEPNTVRAFITSGTDFVALTDNNSIVFVVENYPYFGESDIRLGPFSDSDAMTIAVADIARCGFATCPPAPSVTIPAYDPSLYPTASESLPISGYVAGNWYDPAHSGEGVQTEIGDFKGSDNFATQRYLTFAWYTFDASGVPYWIFGSGGFTAGDRQATVPLIYASGGGFAGGGGAALQANWGSVVVDFPNCTSMHFSFESADNLPPAIPHGVGSRTWTRASQINGMTCE